PRGDLSGDEGAAAARAGAAVRPRSSDPEVMEGGARRAAAARGPGVVADSATPRHAPVLARPRQPRALDPLGAPQALVAAVHEGLRRHRLLARGVLHARRDRRALRRHDEAHRARPRPACGGGAWHHVLGPQARGPHRAADGRAGDRRGRVLLRLLTALPAAARRQLIGTTNDLVTL